MLRISFVLISSLVLLVSCQQEQREIGFNGPIEVINQDTVPYVVPAFSFHNQDSVIFGSKELAGKLYAINFFFATCPLQCPMITNNLTAIHEEFKGNDQFQLVSVTLDPDYDHCKRLKQYAQGYGIETAYWSFLKGTEKQTFDLMQKGFYQAVVKDENIPGGIDHSARVILVDEKGRLRKWYNGLKPKELEEMRKDINYLLR